MEKKDLKRDWSINPTAFNGLLDWLDAGEASDGQRYLDIRRRLVSYFDRRNCRTPDELADETLNRIARRLEEEGAIESETPERYCYITARFVLLEYFRRTQRSEVALENVQEPQAAADPSDDEVEDRQRHEKMLEYLGRCTEQLEAVSRRIITGYYYGTERVKINNRRALAESLGLTVNALSIRACRIRDKLEICIEKCVAAG